MSPEVPFKGNKRPEPFPINWVGKEDLIKCCPELEEQIQLLDASDIANIASKVGDALQESYWMALKIVLLAYLGAENINTDEVA